MSYRFDTLAIHAGQPNDAATGAVTVPVYQTSTFQQLEPGVSRGYDYSRTAHPTRHALEENLAALEGARYGLAFSSGMAAIHNVLSTLSAGDHVLATQDLYGGAWRIFTKTSPSCGSNSHSSTRPISTQSRMRFARRPNCCGSRRRRTRC